MPAIVSPSIFQRKSPFTLNTRRAYYQCRMHKWKYSDTWSKTLFSSDWSLVSKALCCSCNFCWHSFCHISSLLRQDDSLFSTSNNFAIRAAFSFFRSCKMDSFWERWRCKSEISFIWFWGNFSLSWISSLALWQNSITNSFDGKATETKIIKQFYISSYFEWYYIYLFRQPMLFFFCLMPKQTKQCKRHYLL